MLVASLAELEARQREIDDLNVFPVADGDTGRNMVATLRGLVGAMEALRVSIGPVDLEEVDRDLVVKAVARAALASAHGNSGVILSQLIRGAAMELGSGRGRKVSPFLLGKAMRGAAEQGSASIPEPREGTMLTVARDIADALERAYPEPVLIDDDISPEDQDAMLAEALEVAVDAGTASVDRGPDLLDVLREKGVVDSGGYGLVVILAAALAALRGEHEVPLAHRRPAAGPVVAGDSPGRFSYCVNFTLSGSGLEPAHEARRLRESGIGDSVLVVGDSELIRVHVHTDVPAEARALFEQLGTIEHFEQEDMNEQVRDRDRRLADGVRTAFTVMVEHGDAAGLFELDGADVAVVEFDGGDIDGAFAVDSEHVVVATSAAAVEAAAGFALAAEQRIEVVDAGNLAAAMLALADGDDLDHRDGAAVNAERLRIVLGGVVAGGIRDAGDGSAEAVIAGEVIARGEPGALLGQLAGRLADGAFVTGVIDPGGDLAAGDVEGALAELDLGESPLRGWHLVIACEA